jgi:hypothetical protein
VPPTTPTLVHSVAWTPGTITGCAAKSASSSVAEAGSHNYAIPSAVRSGLSGLQNLERDHHHKHTTSTLSPALTAAFALPRLHPHAAPTEVKGSVMASGDDSWPCRNEGACNEGSKHTSTDPIMAVSEPPSQLTSRIVTKKFSYRKFNKANQSKATSKSEAGKSVLHRCRNYSGLSANNGNSNPSNNTSGAGKCKSAAAAAANGAAAGAGAGMGMGMGNGIGNGSSVAARLVTAKRNYAITEAEKMGLLVLVKRLRQINGREERIAAVRLLDPEQARLFTWYQDQCKAMMSRGVFRPSPAQLQLVQPVQPVQPVRPVQPVQQPREVPPAVVALSLEERRRAIQRQLLLLIHAHQCTCPGGTKCEVHHCAMMKGVLQHMRGCRDGRGCKVPHCASSRQILIHYGQCPRHGCPICPARPRAVVAAPQADPQLAPSASDLFNLRRLLASAQLQ